MQKAKRISSRAAKPRPISAGFFQQAKSSVHVGADKIVWPMNRAVHMAFSGEVNNRAWSVRDQQFCKQLTITDIALEKLVTVVGRHSREVRRIARVSQLVEVHNTRSLIRQPVQDKVRADEPGPACHENCFGLFFQRQLLRNSLP